jgi:hypothetical protein
MARSRTPWLVVTLAVVAAALLGWGALSDSWYVADGERRFRVGLLSAEQCQGGECRSTSINRIDDRPAVTRVGLAVALGGVLAAIGFLAAAARALARTARLAWVPRLALVLAVFAVFVGVAYLVLAPWPEMGMGPSRSALAYFAGAAVGGGLVAVFLGGLRSA